MLFFFLSNSGIFHQDMTKNVLATPFDYGMNVRRILGIEKDGITHQRPRMMSRIFSAS
jgi:hypothetical protein